MRLNRDEHSNELEQSILRPERDATLRDIGMEHITQDKWAFMDCYFDENQDLRTGKFLLMLFDYE